MNLKTLLSRQRKIPNWTLVVLLVSSGIGFLDATYLSARHFLGSMPTCSVFSGCEDVLTSPYSMIGLVPVAFLGSIYYLLIFLFTVAYIDSRRNEVIAVAALLTIAGLMATAWFVYLQIFVIQAICLYCMLSALMTMFLFAAGIKILKSAKIVEGALEN